MMIQFAFPYQGELLIKPGEKVTFKTPLMKLHSKEEVQVSLAQVLHTSPKKIFQCLKKFVGDEVKKGDLIAESASMLSKRHYYSEYEGVFKEIHHNDGTITLEVDTTEEAQQDCFFEGEVVDLEKKETNHGNTAVLKLKVDKVKQYELKEASSFFGGKIVYCNDPYKVQLTIEDVKNNIVVDDDVPGYEQIKYEALGAEGFVSLKSLTEATSTNFAHIKNIDDYEKIVEQKLDNCLIDKENNIIYFYE